MKPNSHSNLLHSIPSRAAALVACGLCLLSPDATQGAAIEKPDLKFGFIKLTDCVPIIIAKELNYFEDEGLYVTVEAQSN